MAYRKIQGFDRLHNVSGQTDWVNLADGELVPFEPGTNTPATTGGDTTITGTTSVAKLKSSRIFRFKIDWFCGNLRVQYLHPWGDTGTHPDDTTYYGCASAAEPTGICTAANIDDCWCEILQVPIAGIDTAPITTPGMVGLYSGSMSSWYTTFQNHRYDNMRVSAFAGGCGVVCDPWLENWSVAQTDTVPFKFLYEGALFDYSAGRNMTPAPDVGKIDVATEPPATVSSYNHARDANPYCNGWNLLNPSSFPGPTVTGGNINDIIAFLEPMHSAVVYDHDASNPGWLKNSDSSNPVPMVTDGSTPINSALMEAFDWYKDLRTTGDWVTDSFEGCRDWYVILITDGEEACEFESCSPGDPGCALQSDGTWWRVDEDRVCDTDQGADMFAKGAEGVDPLPVYTIGFSESVSEDSPLRCIAEQTGGEFMTAENATQLSDALYNVFYNLQDRARSFSPFKVAPPPSSVGGNNTTRDYLAVYPLFLPQEGQTLWAGNLYGFKLNKAQPTLPTVNDCELDTDQLIWDAAVSLRAQLDAHTEADPQRYVFMGRKDIGPPVSWVRHNLSQIPYNATLRTEFMTRTGVATPIVAQQVANFVRYIYQDNDADLGNAGPPAEARPDNYPVYGEFFHSQPVVVNPPNSPLFFYDYGFGVEGERGVHNYQDFIAKHAKRRRIVLAGANDGMLHAIDGGVWNRDRDDENPETDIYDKMHDLGNGTELFAWVPQAVMDNLYLITAGSNLPHTQPKYMVDGPITTSDAFIDHDGDGTREWRTVALASMRRGGRGVVALDITQPDPIGSGPDYEPEAEKFPGCFDGQTAGCFGDEYPKVLWELSDTDDQEPNCPASLSGDDCAPYWDLGWTWSKPAIARIAIYNDDDPPDDVYVAFFGGGWDQNDPSVKHDNETPGDTSDDQWRSNTGNFLYAVDVATGTVLFKSPMLVDVPGGVTALDSDNDGFHDRIYFADTDGGVWKLKYPEPTSDTATGEMAGTLTRIFDFRDDFPDRQEFYTRPIPVPVSFDSSGYTWAVVLGTGDRSDLARTDSGIDHFFFLVDADDDPAEPRTAADLIEVDYLSLNGTFDCNGSEALVPPKYGWYLSLRETEKVMFDATVIDGYVRFPTFDPTATVATHRVPDQCGVVPDEDGDVDLGDICYASGLGRTYKLWYQCGLGDYQDHTDIITGSEDYTIDDTTYVAFPTSDPEGSEGVGETEETDLQRRHTTTNWRQQ